MAPRHLAPIALVVLAGCGGADTSGQSGPAARETPAPPSAPAPAGGPAKVAIADFEYRPRALEVAGGTKVTWVNRDSSNHTVTFAKGPGDLGNVDPKRRVSARFEEPGRYAYVCQYHPTMKGTVTVR